MVQRVIDHVSVVGTMAELVVSSDGERRQRLIVDTSLVLTTGEECYSEAAVSGLIRQVADYQARHGIAEVLFRQVG